MKKLLYVVVVACLALALMTGVALGAAKKPTTQFPKNARVTVTSVPPFFFIISWTAATGTFDAYRLDLTAAKGAATRTSFNAGTATRFTIETVKDEGYPYVAPGTYKITVNATSGGVVAASLSLKGTVQLK